MTSAPVRTSWLMTRETLFSLPGMAEAETMTMSLARISSFPVSYTQLKAAENPQQMLDML